ncbi:MAG: hypothetical protein ACPGLV_18820, partial [Bacteroidia bacterium]
FERRNSGYALTVHGKDLYKEVQKIDFKISALKERFIPNPDFNTFLQTTNSFYKNDISEESYVEFLNITDTLIKLKRSKAEIRKFIRFFEAFNSKKELSGKGGKIWSVDENVASLKMKKAPYLEFENVTLFLSGKNDTMQISGTSGKYYIESHKWRGKEGEVTWERVGLSSSDVYANLSSYKIDMNSNGYKADSVEFYNLDAYSEPIAGNLIDQLDGKKEKASFPKFRSFKQKFELNDLDYYLIYKGGFGMEGRTIVGSGAGYTPAKLTILRNDKKFMNLYSYDFLIRPNEIIAGKCAATVYIENDSIYHPNIILNLERESGHIQLTLSPAEAVMPPFSNTYHQLEMYADHFDCYLDSSFFEIRSRRDPDGRATFESMNYFSRARFDKMKGTMSYNPIFKMNELYLVYKKRIYTEDELTSYFGVDRIESIQTLLVILSAQGFISYDQKIKEVL